MGGYQTNQVLWYFYQIITDKYSIMEHNNSPRSIKKISPSTCWTDFLYLFRQKL